MLSRESEANGELPDIGIIHQSGQWEVRRYVRVCTYKENVSRTSTILTSFSLMQHAMILCDMRQRIRSEQHSLPLSMNSSSYKCTVISPCRPSHVTYYFTFHPFEPNRNN